MPVSSERIQTKNCRWFLRSCARPFDVDVWIHLGGAVMRRFVPAAVVLATGALAISITAYTQSPRTANPANRAVYGAEQATRGKTLYTQNCSKCHMENLQGNCPAENVRPSAAYVCAAPRTAPPLVGDAFLQRWYSAGDLYARIRWSMPADNVGGLSADDNLAILAYVLQSNGFSAGRELRNDATALKTMVLQEKTKNTNTAVKDSVNDLGISEAYYTEEQAARGKNYYYGACGMCHTAEPNGPNGVNMPHETGLGWHWGNQWRYTVQAGKQYLDIVAYLLKQNGFPAGKDELTDNLNLMRNMTMEKGYQRLFNGKDLTGWAFVLGANCPPKTEQGCAQTSPGSTFTVSNGILYDTGTPHGYMYPKKKFGPNFTLRAEYRYMPYPGMEDDKDFYGNSGYLLFIEKHDVWPRTLEIQGRSNMEMNINAMDGHAMFTFDDELRKKVRNPAGQWNAVEIVSKGNEVWNYLNGTLLSHVSRSEER